MNERQVTVWSQKYGPEVHDGERDELDSWSDSYELKSDAPWFGADPVQFAVAVIQGEGCDIEPSREVYRQVTGREAEKETGA